MVLNGLSTGIRIGGKLKQLKVVVTFVREFIIFKSIILDMGFHQPISEANDELMEEQLSRIESFFGEKPFQNIKDAFVIVVGLGGVGSHAAHMLARSGIRKLRLVDFDNVTLSSLNRHAVATRSDVGISKVEATKAHLLEIVPHCEIEAIPLMFEADAADELLKGIYYTN